MKIHAGIFKAYDIRGVYPEQLNKELAYRLGRAYALFIQGENPGKKFTFGVGWDMRSSSPELLQGLTAGLTDQGANVVRFGLVATPTFYFGVAKNGYDGGVMITASHNPKEYNGFKMVRSESRPISGDNGIEEIRELVIKNEFSAAEKGTTSDKNDIVVDQIQNDLTFIDLQKLKPFTIVADPANAMAALYVEEVMKHIPGKLIKMNFELDGTFPAHQADPLQDETLVELKKRVLAEKADLGLGLDGDGDRIFFIDNTGQTIPPEIVRGLIAQEFLKEHPGATICYDIRPGKITKDMIEAAGGVPVLTRVGHSFIKQVMLEHNAVFAGESSGHFFAKMEFGYFEVPVIVLLKLLQLMSEAGKPVSEIIAPYKKYHQSGEINSGVEDKQGKMKELAAKYEKDALSVSWMDGVTVEFPDFWFNVRASNTEPLLRLNLEATSRALCDEKTKEILGVIRG